MTNAGKHCSACLVVCFALIVCVACVGFTIYIGYPFWISKSSLHPAKPSPLVQRSSLITNSSKVDYRLNETTLATNVWCLKKKSWMCRIFPRKWLSPIFCLGFENFFAQYQSSIKPSLMSMVLTPRKVVSGYIFDATHVPLLDGSNHFKGTLRSTLHALTTFMNSNSAAPLICLYIILPDTPKQDSARACSPTMMHSMVSAITDTLVEEWIFKPRDKPISEWPFMHSLRGYVMIIMDFSVRCQARYHALYPRNTSLAFVAADHQYFNSNNNVQIFYPAASISSGHGMYILE